MVKFTITFLIAIMPEAIRKHRTVSRQLATKPSHSTFESEVHNKSQTSTSSIRHKKTEKRGKSAKSASNSELSHGSTILKQSRTSSVSSKTKGSKKSRKQLKQSKRGTGGSVVSETSTVQGNVVPREPNERAKTRSISPESFGSGPFYIYCDQNKKYFCNLSYMIAPGKTMHIHIVIYHRMAVIYTKEDSATVRTVRLGDKHNWLAFSVFHKMNIPSLDNILKFYAHRIEFDIYEDVGPLLNKKERGSYFICYNRMNINENPLSFEKVYETKKDELPEKSSNSSRERFKIFEQFHPHTNEVRDLLCGIPCAAHYNKALNKILYVERLANKMQETASEDTGRRDNSPTEINDFVITGDQLFFDKREWFQEKYNFNKKIGYFSYWFLVENTLTKAVREKHFPLGISLVRLDNVPLTDRNIDPSMISLEYSLGQIADNINVLPQFSEEIVDWKGSVNINHCKTFFLKEKPMKSILNSLQFHKLKITIWYNTTHRRSTQRGGYRQYVMESTITNDSIFTRYRQDEDFATRIVYKPLPEPYFVKIRKVGQSGKKTIEYNPIQKKLLGYAFVDCSPLLHGRYRIDCNAPVTNWDQSEMVTGDIFNHYNAMQIHEGKIVPSPVEGIFSEKMLRDMDTNLKVVFLNNNKNVSEVSIRFSGTDMQTVIEHISKQPSVYRRLIVKFKKNVSQLKSLLQRIHELNAEVLPRKDCYCPGVPFWNVRRIPESKNDERASQKDYPCAITGFLIDNFNSSLLVVEGIADLTFTSSLLDIMLLPSDAGEVLYNSNILFYTRFYEEFLHYGGIFVVTLKCSLADIKAKFTTARKESIPTRTARAVEIIENINLCHTMETVVRNSLFPHCQDLLSLDTEYGISHYCERYIFGDCC